jgi:hypothetical protein
MLVTLALSSHWWGSVHGVLSWLGIPHLLRIRRLSRSISKCLWRWTILILILITASATSLSFPSIGIVRWTQVHMVLSVHVGFMADRNSVVVLWGRITTVLLRDLLSVVGVVAECGPIVAHGLRHPHRFCV